ncbi:hypothetical protein F4553_004929 [Allocatelliglobosispora scoriae]|uniref:Septum formation-related domain-containing protein n=1 Tax=Allocatelliglobosispora scoriae TaxID=643052 RepID=A0A841BXV4_9ACTN|nr:septum formation family protein [Allocatelliglobosispora scoriae]MBB5871550.1 hypothetical protein [Allocatelliglobosispora scoriae]
MRRAPAVLAALLMAALAGCSASPPPGTDGDVGNEWAALPAAVAYLPKAGDCYRSSWLEQDARRDDNVVPCDSTHFAETAFVGEFTGAAARLTSPPSLSSKDPAAIAAQATAFAECDKQATAYLGRSWYSLDTYIDIALPTNSAWSAGVHWYRCDLGQYPFNSSSNSAASRSKSLKAEPATPVCVNMKNDKWPIVSCTAKHNTEFVGGFAFTPAQAPTAGTDASWAPIHSRCMKLVAGYIGVSLDRARSQWTDYAYSTYSKTHWDKGRRIMRCFVYIRNSSMTKSAKGTGGKGVPRWS